jgi:hypothetical protein
MNNMKNMMDDEGGVELVKNVEEASAYPSADKQYPSVAKFMSYEAISTGVGGKK